MGKDTIFAKNAKFLPKNAEQNKGDFGTNVPNLRAKFQVSSIILTSFRRGVILYPLATPQNEPLKNPTQISVNLISSMYFRDGSRSHVTFKTNACKNSQQQF